mmetsp:Transcript_27702/g.82559  ORF Transcript_27702/g.82559 Transcript_27702/m.82559 type:complete len:202 (+) Transcript_27702:1067-1672(+)
MPPGVGGWSTSCRTRTSPIRAGAAGSASGSRRRAARGGGRRPARRAGVRHAPCWAARRRGSCRWRASPRAWPWPRPPRWPSGPPRSPSWPCPPGPAICEGFGAGRPRETAGALGTHRRRLAGVACCTDSATAGLAGDAPAAKQSGTPARLQQPMPAGPNDSTRCGPCPSHLFAVPRCQTEVYRLTTGWQCDRHHSEWMHGE